ncbi:MAG: hypothetical protein WCV82_00985 [Candidatus Paceibacterota bacterium]
MKNRPAGDRGLIKIILIIIIGLLVLSYFGINLRQLVNTPTNKDNVSYVASTTITVWDSYLKVPASYAWRIFIDLIWTPAIDNLEAMKEGQPTNINEISSSTRNLPTIPFVQ